MQTPSFIEDAKPFSYGQKTKACLRLQKPSLQSSLGPGFAPSCSGSTTTLEGKSPWERHFTEEEAEVKEAVSLRSPRQLVVGRVKITPRRGGAWGLLA